MTESKKNNSPAVPNRTYLKWVMFSFFAYTLLIILAVILSMINVEESYKSKMISFLEKNPQCMIPVKQKGADLLNPFEILVNHRYWFASSRFSHKTIDNESCFSQIAASVASFKKKISIVFINDNSEIVLSISNY